MSEPLPTGMPDDRAIWPILSELAACLCAELTRDGAPSPCFCGVVPGNEIPMDAPGSCDDCGAGYVRLEEGFPSTQRFPEPDSAATCRSVLAFSVVVGVARCAPTGDTDYPPSQEELAEFSRQVFADMAAIRRAIRCCLTDDKFEGIQYALGFWTPIVPEGGVGGGEWRLTIGEPV